MDVEQNKTKTRGGSFNACPELIEKKNLSSAQKVFLSNGTLLSILFFI